MAPAGTERKACGNNTQAKLQEVVIRFESSKTGSPRELMENIQPDSQEYIRFSSGVNVGAFCNLKINGRPPPKKT